MANDRLTVISGGNSSVGIGSVAVVLNGKAQPIPSGFEYGYWLLVIDRKAATPEIVASEITNTPNDVPSGIAAYSGDQYILIVSSQIISYRDVPQGELYTFLEANGGGGGLNALEQIASDAGSAAGGGFTYGMVGVMDDSNSFESFNFGDGSTALALELQKYGDYWTPIQTRS